MDESSDQACDRARMPLRTDHWPHAADHARRHFDPKQIEQQALRIIARGIRTQRLVAFVGAGASMAYGRLTWSALMDHLYHELCSRPPASSGPWPKIRSKLWSDQIENFREESDHPVKAEILAECFKHLLAPPSGADGGPSIENHLHELTTASLKNHHGFIRELARQMQEVGLDVGSKGLDAILTCKTSSARPEEMGLRGAAKALCTAQRPATPRDFKSLLRNVAEALQEQPRHEGSPLRHLVVDWGIRRFVTTNYDGEIERALTAFGFRGQGSTDATNLDPTQKTLHFDRHATGDALAFAFEGSRRHAAVLHLHGDVSNTRTLVITESDYQRLYLSEHEQRDLVTNATLANFAANPMIFVGSDVNEDDVLRPIRQFMTGPGHRSDRMAVAIFAATRPSDRCAMQAARLLLKYRVHAIHAGTAQVRERDEHGHESVNCKPDWLYAFVQASRKFKALVDLVRKLGSKPSAKTLEANCEAGLSAFNTAWEAVKGTEGLVSIEGVPVSKGLSSAREHLLFPDIELPFLKPHQMLAFRGKPSDRLVNIRRWKVEDYVWCQLQFEQRANLAMNCFVCAKLISLRSAVEARIDEESRLPQTYQKDVADVAVEVDHTGAKNWRIHTRHRVCMQPDTVKGRFSAIDEDRLKNLREARHQDFDEGIPLLVSAIKGHHGGRFATHKGRRLIVVCAARGAGKGGQFDHLLRRGAANGARRGLSRVLAALTPPKGPPVGPRTILHFNLSFADEVAGMVSHLCDAVFFEDPQAAPDDAIPCADLLERLERALTSLQRREDDHRLVLILGNAGVLFDARGEAKNGLVHRVLRMLQAKRFHAAPMDILMYLGESQVPIHLRLSEEASASLPLRVQPEGARSDAPTAQGDHRQRLADHRLRRRLKRLNINQHHPEDPGILVHALEKTRAEQLAAAYFPDLHRSLATQRNPQHPEGAGETRFRDLYLETGGSRFAQTIILACVDALAGTDGDEAPRLLDHMINRLRGSASQSAVEATIEMVLDTWAQRHLTGPALPKSAHPHLQSTAPAAFRKACDVMSRRCECGSRAGQAFWRLATEVLWHLSAFSHPIELPTLMACSRVSEAVRHLQDAMQPPTRARMVGPQDIDVLSATVEWMTHWALLFRIGACPLTGPMNELLAEVPGTRYRYATHRHIQRHFLKLMGGRNVEATYWDQFTTTLYASQPDETPALRPDVHRTLSSIVHTLTRYPLPDSMEADASSGASIPPAPPPIDPNSHSEAGPSVHQGLGMLQEAEQIRAAYFLVRSTYSMGVVTQLPHQPSGEAGGCGQMEQYRRMVRWILHAARYWEVEHLELRQKSWNAPTPSAHERPPMGIFYPGELIWLYNECGVISLAQGKLHDAEQLLSQAEIAARALEGDDTGSLHTRIRLHAALTHIERGRPHLARRVLQPIADRQGGHSVPPYLARFYLGLLEHIGGNYHQADLMYGDALKGLHRHRRSRAAAFVLMNQADLILRVSQRTEVRKAITLADEAISLAQQGGHEDLRHLAHLARVRLRIQTRSFEGEPLFEELNAAQRYAVRMDMPRIACEVHELRARLLSVQGEYLLSAAEATRSLEIAALYDLKLLKARGMLTLAKIYAQRGESQGARALVQTGMEIATSADYYTCVRGFDKLEMALERPASVHLVGKARHHVDPRT